MLNTQKDKDFANIPDLSWLPWLGSRFYAQEKRLLIVGESHYAQGETAEEFQKDLDRQRNPNFTRKLIEETQIQDLYKYKLLDNFWEALLAKKPNKAALWEHVAYYNFVQRSMDYSSFDGKKAEQPNTTDFRNGWKTFAEVVKIIQPTDCIFLGLKAAAGFGNLKTDSSVSHFEYHYPPKIGNMSPVEGSVIISGQKIDVSFIQHCSSYFSPEAWHPFLVKRHREIIDFLHR